MSPDVKKHEVLLPYVQKLNLKVGTEKKELKKLTYGLKPGKLHFQEGNTHRHNVIVKQLEKRIVIQKCIILRKVNSIAEGSALFIAYV